LGDFTASKIEKPFQVFMRITEREEYIKVITKNGRVHGAVLIGETDLEETLENLILNQTDISQIEDDFLNPQVDLEDYFD
jgi:NAD(P)H-nitrite reductase large subunit